MNWYLSVLKKYTVFDGRASRTEYWMFQLFNFIVLIVLSVLGAIALGRAGNVLMAVYVLGVFLPSLGVGIRRLHDIGRSGWWLLIALVPLVGGIVLLVFSVLESQAGDNAYGANPHPLAAP